MQFETTTQSMHREVRRRIEACLETGNYEHARTVMGEYEHEYPDEAHQLRHDLIPQYNVAI